MQRIYKWFTNQCPDGKPLIYVNWFAKTFKPDTFQGIETLMAAYIEYCNNLYIVPTKEFLNSFLKTEGKKVIRQYNIKLETMSALDYRETSQLEEAYQIISSQAHAMFDSYIAEDLTGRNFKVDMHDFMTDKKSEKMQEALISAYPKLTDGSDLNDVTTQLRDSLNKLDKAYDISSIRSIDMRTEPSDSDKMVFLAKTGLPCIDGDIGGIYTKILTTLTAQPEGGKTRMGLVHWAYPILTEAKKDVAFYETELTQGQVENILIAYHITRLYGGRIKIPDSKMNIKDGLTEEEQRIYESAKIDLFESGKYGKFIFIKKPVVETLREDIETKILNSGNLGLVVIDYMGLIKSEPVSKYDKRLDQWEIITEAYEIVRDLLMDYDFHALCINQFNDKGIDAAEAGRPIRPGMVQGGHIVQRHSDYDLSLTFTEEQRMAKVRQLANSKKRGTAGFESVLLDVDLAVSIFRQRVGM